MNRVEAESDSTLGKYSWWGSSDDKQSKEQRIASLEEQVKSLLERTGDMEVQVTNLSRYATEDGIKLQKHEKRSQHHDHVIVDLENGVHKIWSWMYALVQQNAEFIKPDAVPVMKYNGDSPPWAVRGGTGSVAPARMEPPPAMKRPSRQKGGR